MYTFTTTPFVAEHVACFTEQDRPADVIGMAQQRLNTWDAYAQFPSWTLFRKDAGGQELPILSCGGIWLWDGVAEVWAVVGREAGAHPVRVVRFLQRRLAGELAQTFHRLQTTVRCDAPHAQALVRLLGFAPQQCMCGCGVEQILRAYAPDGTDCQLFAYFPRGIS